MAANFEWRADNSREKIVNTGQGGLFACSAQQTKNPSLTLVPPSTWNSGGTIDPAITPSPGDDLSPPNAVEARRINGIAVPVSATAGWSRSPPKNEGIFPSCVEYDVRIVTNNMNKNDGSITTAAIEDSLEVNVSLEYTNPRHDEGESMMVKVAIAKTLVNVELGTELALVATQFQEFVLAKNNWVDITADVDYTQTADAVVDAVMQDPTAGQTAGKATITAKTVELTIGPFSAKARLNLTFQADKLYSYQAMSIATDGADIGTHRILPLWVNLPFAPVHHEAGLSNLAVRLQAPPGTSILPLDQFRDAYQHLKDQEVMDTTTIVAVSDLTPQPQLRTVGYQFQWESLPPRSTGILAWLCLPNPVDVEEDGFDFMLIGKSLEELSPADVSKTQAQAAIQVPFAEDVASLQVPLPGHGPMGALYRLKVKMPEAQPRQQPQFIMNLTISDKSGSTGMRVEGAEPATVRKRFNELAELRFLKRLESIPALVQAGVLRTDDVWMDAFLAFDHTAPLSSIHRVMFRVGDVVEDIVQVVQGIRSSNPTATTNWPTILDHVKALRAVNPGGSTDFSVGPRTLVQAYAQWKMDAQRLVPSGALSPCTYVEFDTDGGHNGASEYLKSLRSFCDVFDVRNGVVTGFGCWLNQDCATKVARVLGSVPALLALHVPESGSEGLDKVFRTGFSAWIDALRRPPKMSLKVSAGCVSFSSGLGSRNANAVEVLALRRIGESHQRMPKFGPPDVSNDTYTKATIIDVPSGDELLLYIVSRLGTSHLAQALEIQTSVEGSPHVSIPVKARLWNEEESKRGNYLAYDWLKVLTSKPGNGTIQLAPLMATSLASRLEDEVVFRFNIASPSGRTSFLGRCKTVADRDSIDVSHQPGVPTCPIVLDAEESELKHQRRRLGGIEVRRQQQMHSTALAFAKVQQRPRMAKAFAKQGVSSFQRHSVPGFMSGGISITMDDVGDEVTRSVGFGPIRSVAMRSPHTTSPVPTGFGHSSKSIRLASPIQNNVPEQCDPSWMDAMEIPVGLREPLSKQDYHALLHAINDVVYACYRLKGDSSVTFVCDVCNRPIGQDQARYHCYDCQDFDCCALCRDVLHLPFHRVALINPWVVANTTTAAVAEDPLVGSMLGTSLPLSAHGTVLDHTPKVDQTVKWCRLRIGRFLLAVLHWWPLFRVACPYRDQLPTELSGDNMAQKIANSFSNDDIAGQMRMLTVVVESLIREHLKSINPTEAPPAVDKSESLLWKIRQLLSSS